MITERISFVDSRSETMIQIDDLLAAATAGKIGGDRIARAVGKLQIIRMQGGRPKSLRVLTMSRAPGGKTDLFNTLRTMTSAGRSMIKPRRGVAA
jgi:hypothetical protein